MMGGGAEDKEEQSFSVTLQRLASTGKPEGSLASSPQAA